MPCSRQDIRRAALAPFVLSALLAAPPVGAEIFKCATKDGTPRYQNFPCDVDSLGLLSPSSVTKPSLPGAVGRQQQKTGTTNEASPVKSTYSAEPRIGMTADEVRALLGEPEEMVADEPAEGGPVSNWRYADGRIVQFDNKHRVLGVQR